MKYAALSAGAASLLRAQVRVPGPGGAPSGSSSIFLVANTFAQSVDGGNTAVTSAINTTGATLLVVGVSMLPATTTTVTDSKSNTWVLTNNASNGVKTAQFYATSVSVGTGHTFTATNTTPGFPAIFVAAFATTNTSAPLDQHTANSPNGTTTVQPGSITPGSNNELVVTSVCFNGTSGNTLSIDSGFTITNQAQGIGGQSYGGGLAYIVQGGALAVNPTWTLSPSSIGLNATIASYLHS